MATQNGNLRRKVVSVYKYDSSETIVDGFPLTYNITNSFTVTRGSFAGSYASLTDVQFASLSDSDYAIRFRAFCNYIDILHPGMSSYTHEYSSDQAKPDGTDLVACPIVPLVPVYTMY